MGVSAKQFDPQTQFTAALDALDTQILSAASTLERMRWLRDRIAEEFAALEKRTADFTTFTEAEAAAIFKVENENSTQADYAEKAFAALRRRYNFPHCKVGKAVRYTRQQLAEIAAILEIRNVKRNAAMKKAA